MTELIHPDRLAKLERMREAGIDPYPARGVDATPVADVQTGGGTSEEPGEMIGTTVTIAGRLMGMRDFGKLIFAPIQDRTGRLQVGIQKGRIEKGPTPDWWPERKFLDPGDLVSITGELGWTQKGELTIWAAEVKLLAKALAPPPEKFHGLADKEVRYRRRYVDLWASEGVRDVFITRSRILSHIRSFLEGRGYLEVETPTLHPVMGGATALPFSTHHNALDMELFLRIAPELYLKRLIVGGLERVFEISRNFRNEGISNRHNPEFTMLELYQAQGDYTHMMEISETMISGVATDILGSTEVEFRGATYNVQAPFQKQRYDELFEKHNEGVSIHDEEAVAARAKELGVTVAPGLGHWKLVGEVFDETVEPHLAGPIFVTHYPSAICPLAKPDPTDPRFAERFELFIGGMELANAFSELNDPILQMQKFEEQVAMMDPETPGEVDVDYVQALEYGMPPAGGLGIGIDRLVMVLTGQDSIRDVLLFPTMRRQSAEELADESTNDPSSEAEPAKSE
ncbi:MAG: lysyl-tRNA synthetase class 2 [Planctomycetota bacterium]|jgi:lysyl-tRNA synthetase class 2